MPFSVTVGRTKRISGLHLRALAISRRRLCHRTSPSPTRALSPRGLCRYPCNTRVIPKTFMIHPSLIQTSINVIWPSSRGCNLGTRTRPAHYFRLPSFHNQLCRLSPILRLSSRTTPRVHQSPRVAHMADLFEQDELPHLTAHLTPARIHFLPLCSTRIVLPTNAGRVDGMAAPLFYLLFKHSKSTFFVPRKAMNAPTLSTTSPKAIAKGSVVAGAIAQPM